MANYLIPGTPASLTFIQDTLTGPVFIGGSTLPPYYSASDAAHDSAHALVVTFAVPPLVQRVKILQLTCDYSEQGEVVAKRFGQIYGISNSFKNKILGQDDGAIDSVSTFFPGNLFGDQFVVGASGSLSMGISDGWLFFYPAALFPTCHLPSTLHVHFFDWAGSYSDGHTPCSFSLSNFQLLITDSLLNDGSDGNLCIGDCDTFNAHSIGQCGTAGDWYVIGPGGVLGSNATPNGWSVTYSSGPPATLTVCAPCGAAPGKIAVTYQASSGALVTSTVTVQDCSLCGPGGGGGTGSFANDDGLTYEATLWGRHRRAYADDADALYYGEASDELPLVWQDRGLAFSGTNPWVRGEVTSTGQVVYLSYTSGGGILVRSSTDAGATWSSPMTVSASGDHGAFVITRHGTKHFFWRTSGGAIQGVIWDGANNVIEPVFTAVTSGADSNPIACDEFLGANGEHRIGLMYRSGGSFLFKSAVDGKTFS